MQNYQRIQTLSPLLVNRISAGEVVERPANALKELIENSIDANATDIQIKLINGGTKLISVIDNGCGIHPDDIHLTIQNHTTSKLKNENDLYNIKTLGFRGEGLASIASISDFSLASKQKDCAYASKIICSYNEEVKISPVALNEGTIAEINNIYYNIPARKKFLKSDATEYQYCKNIFEKIALANCHIKFTLLHNNKLIYTLPIQSLKERINIIFGDEYLQNSHEILEIQSETLILSGYIYNNHTNLSKNNLQMIFINNRYVRDKIIQNAIKQAFNGVLHSQESPQYILFLTIDPQEIDINVHPTKQEVRFRNSQQIHSFIYHTIHKILATPIKELQQNNNMPYNKSFTKTSYHHINTTTQLSPDTLKTWFNVNSPIKETININNHINEQQISDQLLPETPRLGFAIAQLHYIYILAQNVNSLILVDMHAAHERIILEKLHAQIYAKNISTQQLLIPLQIKLEEYLLEYLTNYKTEFTNLGFDFTLQANYCIIHSIPSILNEYDIENIIHSTLIELSNYGNSNTINNKILEILAKTACHLAIRANQALTTLQMNTILRDLENADRGNYCNHGRPTWIELTIEHLDNLFLRGK